MIAQYFVWRPMLPTHESMSQPSSHRCERTSRNDDKGTETGTLEHHVGVGRMLGKSFAALITALAILILTLIIIIVNNVINNVQTHNHSNYAIVISAQQTMNISQQCSNNSNQYYHMPSAHHKSCCSRSTNTR